eukprot:SAG25_NODE_4_length_30349_cov_110.018280_15_plen_86_part_00
MVEVVSEGWMRPGPEPTPAGVSSSQRAARCPHHLLLPATTLPCRRLTVWVTAQHSTAQHSQRQRQRQWGASQRAASNTLSERASV